jgi:hypothetical protein
MRKYDKCRLCYLSFELASKKIRLPQISEQAEDIQLGRSFAQVFEGSPSFLCWSTPKGESRIQAGRPSVSLWIYLSIGFVIDIGTSCPGHRFSIDIVTY